MCVSDQNNKCPPSEKEHEKSCLHGIQPKHTILLQRGPGERAGQAGVHPAALALGPGGDRHRQAGPHTRYVAYSNFRFFIEERFFVDFELSTACCAVGNARGR